MGKRQGDKGVAPQKVVLDANVVVKWYLKEEYSEQALRLRDDYVSGRIAIISPALLEYEVLNALKYSGVYSKKELIDIARSLNKYGFEFWRLKGQLMEETIMVADKYDISVYNASYLALANIMKVNFYTADEESLAKVANLKRLNT